MNVKCDFLLVMFIVIPCCVVSQEKETTVTGGITRDKETGTRVDLGISHKRDNWDFNGSVFGASGGHRGGSLGVTHTGKNFEVGGSVFGDNRGSRGFGLSGKWKFRRSLQKSGETFDVIVVVNPCNFDVYDQNEDEIISKPEIIAVFIESAEADRLFNALDLNGDGHITRDEFSASAPQVINKCKNVTAEVPYNV